MAAFVDMLGATLLSKNGEQSTEKALSGKSAVGIYFSAHWCPPCRGFTPKLAEYYNNTFKAKGLEIVFVSSDRDVTSFNDYYAEQPWLALPYDNRDLKAELSKKFKVRGIPSFVILGPDGKTITTDGRSAIMKDPEGMNYPWIPPTPAEKAKLVLDTLGADLIKQTGGKPIGLYFSAHWCPPCRGFTPKLAEYYKNGLKDKMEIIFVSGDNDQQAFEEYFGEMPWLALPYEKRKEKEVLEELFQVDGIPSFVVIKPDGSLITSDGRGKVTNDPEGKTFPEGWLPQPFNDVNEDPSPLNEEKCIIMFGSDKEDACAAVKTVAEEYYNAAEKNVESMPIKFFFAPDDGQITPQLRTLTGQTGNQLILLDIPDDGGFYVCDKSTVDAAVVREFISGVQAKTVQRQQLKKG